MSEQEVKPLKEKEYDVVMVEDENGERKPKVVSEGDSRWVEQFHPEETESQHIRKLIFYSKIAAGVSIISLMISLTLLGIGLNADVVLSAEQKTRNILAMGLFILGFFTFVFALALDKKIRKDNEKKEKNSKKAVKVLKINRNKKSSKKKKHP